MIRRQFDPNRSPSKGEINTLPSDTVPDQSLTIKQLLLNHTRGIHSDVADLGGEYFEDEEIPIYTDLNDINEHKQKLVERSKNLKNQIQAEFELEKPKKEQTSKEEEKALENGSNGTIEP